jgi:hypothetical protein
MRNTKLQSYTYCEIQKFPKLLIHLTSTKLRMYGYKRRRHINRYCTSWQTEFPNPVPPPPSLWICSDPASSSCNKLCDLVMQCVPKPNPLATHGPGLHKRTAICYFMSSLSATLRWQSKAPCSSSSDRKMLGLLGDLHLKVYQSIKHEKMRKKTFIATGWP